MNFKRLRVLNTDKLTPLEFSTNWNNKLECNCFTTIRIFNQTKHFRGNHFEVYLQKKSRFEAVVLGITMTKLDDLNDYVCYLDTGYNKAETIAIFRKMYPRIDFNNQKICIILLKKIEPLKAVQSKLF
jgi:hypothetical protein